MYDSLTAKLKELLEGIDAPPAPEPGDPEPTPPVYENTVAEVVDDVIPAESIGKPGIFMAAPLVDYTDRASMMAEAGDRINLYLIIDSTPTGRPQQDLRSLERDVIKCLTAAGPGLGLAGLTLFKVLRGANADDVFPAGDQPAGFRLPYACRRLECQAVYQFAKADGG